MQTITICLEQKFLSRTEGCWVSVFPPIWSSDGMQTKEKKCNKEKEVVSFVFSETDPENSKLDCVLRSA
jgi:hypothetical protein